MTATELGAITRSGTWTITPPHRRNDRSHTVRISRALFRGLVEVGDKALIGIRKRCAVDRVGFAFYDRGSLCEGRRARQFKRFEAIAQAFTRARMPSIGPKIVRKWAKRLQPCASILDIGCGNGGPISEALLRWDSQFMAWTHPETLIAKFWERLPNATVECSSVEESPFFKRTFDAVLAWGLMFLLSADTQRSLIGKVARA
jgi:hypothetical protein